MRLQGLWFDVSVVLVLFVAVVISALAAVHTRHESRQLFVELERLQAQRDRLQIDWGRLQIEQGTLATHGRVEALVRRELSMRPPLPDEIELVVVER